MSLETTFAKFKINIVLIFFLTVISFGLLFSMISSFLGFMGEENLFASAIRIFTFFLAFICVLIGFTENIYKRYLTKESFFLLLLYLIYTCVVYYDLNYVFDSGVFIEEEEKKLIMIRMIRLVFFPVLASLVFRINGLNKILLIKSIFWALFVSLVLSLIVLELDFGQVVDERVSIEGELNSLNLGYWAATLFLISLYLFFKIGDYSRFLIVFLGVFLSLYLMVVAGSRGPIIYSLLIFYYYLMFNNFNKRLKRLINFLGILSIIIILIDYTLLTDLIGNYNPFLRDRLISSIEEQESSGRDELFRIGFEQFSSSPIIGDYFVLTSGSFKGSYPHNILLEALMTFGLLGSIPFFSLLYKTFIRVHYLIKINDDTTWLALLFLISFFKGLSTWSLYGNGLLWLSMFIILSYKLRDLKLKAK